MTSQHGRVGTDKKADLARGRKSRSICVPESAVCSDGRKPRGCQFTGMHTISGVRSTLSSASWTSGMRAVAILSERKRHGDERSDFTIASSGELGRTSDVIGVQEVPLENYAAPAGLNSGPALERSQH